MAYKFQEGNAEYDGEVSGSSFRTAGSLSGSGDLAVTGNMHAAVFYGSGAGITGISSDAVDVTASSGDRAYPLVFTEAAQADGTLGLALNTALNYNPNDGLLSSSAGAEFVGASRFVGALGVTGAMTIAGISGSGALQMVGAATLVGGLNVTGVVSSSGDGRFMAIDLDSQADVLTKTTLGSTVVASSLTSVGTLTSLAAGAITTTGKLSSSAGAEIVGNTVVVGTLDVTGAVEMASSLTVDGDFTAEGNIDLGNATSDTITATGRFDSDIVPSSDSTRDLGTSALQFAEAHVDHGYIDAITATGTSTLTTVDINGGAIDGTTLGATSQSSVKATTLSGSGILSVVGASNLVGALSVTGAIKAASTISASGVSQLVSSISSSGDLAVTGNVHAAIFYGSGAGITGISSDAVDVTASLGASQVYGIVGTQAIQSDGTLGLITTVSGASFNPLDATWGSKLLLSGSKSGMQTSEIQFGEKGGLGVGDSDGYLLTLSSSIAGIDISASQDGGIAIYGGDGAEAGVGIYIAFSLSGPTKKTTCINSLSRALTALSLALLVLSLLVLLFLVIPFMSVELVP